MSEGHMTIEAAFLADVSAVIRDHLADETDVLGPGIHATTITHRLAPVLAAAVRKARAAELREAADEWEQEDTDYVGDWLRDRADRIAVDAPEGGEGR